MIGTKGGKVLQTVYWRKEKLMLAYLLSNKEMQGCVRTFDDLEERLGAEAFGKLFPIVLTDNGTEFADPDLLNAVRTENGG